MGGALSMPGSTPNAISDTPVANASVDTTPNATSDTPVGNTANSMKSGLTTIFSSASKLVNKSTENVGSDYGEVSLLEFMSTIFSRLAYMKNFDFATHYKYIFKDDNQVGNDGTTPITVKQMLENILNDYSYLNKNIEFLTLAEQVNIINGEQAKAQKKSMFIPRTTESLNCGTTLPDLNPNPDNLIFISVANSNYSQCYIVADIRTPNLIWITFRGTSSFKTVMSWFNPRYAFHTPIIPDKNISVLQGVYKLLIENMHTILCAVEDIKIQMNEKLKKMGLEKNSKSNDQIKLIVTGHDLGGSLATLFTYVYAKSVDIPIKHKIACVSIGSPAVFNLDSAKDFCDMCTEPQNVFEYKRLVTQNDIIPNFPKQAGFVHPCSDKLQEEKKRAVYNNCLVQVSNSASTRCVTSGKWSMTPDLKKYKLKCTKKREKNKYGMTDSPWLKASLGYHAQYLGVLFAGAVHISAYMKSPFKSKSTIEINRMNKDTACRVTFFIGEGNKFKTVFFNLAHFRKQNGYFYEDIFVTPENFNMIKDKAFKDGFNVDADSIFPDDNKIDSEALYFPKANSGTPSTRLPTAFPDQNKEGKAILPVLTKEEQKPIQDMSEPTQSEIDAVNNDNKLDKNEEAPPASDKASSTVEAVAVEGAATPEAVAVEGAATPEAVAVEGAPAPEAAVEGSAPAPEAAVEGVPAPEAAVEGVPAPEAAIDGAPAPEAAAIDVAPEAAAIEGAPAPEAAAIDRAPAPEAAAIDGAPPPYSEVVPTDLSKSQQPYFSNGGSKKRKKSKKRRKTKKNKKSKKRK